MFGKVEGRQLSQPPTPLTPLAHHRYYYIMLALTVLYIVFEHDVKRAALPVEADLPLEVAATVNLVLYIREIGNCLRLNPS